MRFILGVFIGLLLAVGIAAGAAYMAFDNLGGWRDFGEHDRSNDVTEEFDVAGFDKIDVGGVFELDVTVGGDFFVEVSGAPAEMDRLEVTVENGELVLDQRRPNRGERRHWRNRSLIAKVSLPSLSGLDISGVIDGDISGVDAVDFAADFSGVGEIDLTGACENLRADISGVGDFDAKDLRCRTADVNVSGIGDASFYASESVDISVSGIGSVAVYGSPSQVEKSGGFLSSISIK